MRAVTAGMLGAMGEDDLSQAALEAVHCWEPTDRVPKRPAMTDFRRRARLHQARWRESKGLPIGTQPMNPRPDGPAPRPVGSRIPLDVAHETGANFVTPGAVAAARARMSYVEPHQMLDSQRLWADLLWGTTLGVNLFGELAADLTLADRAVHTWWPDAPGSVSEVRFEHCPGRLDFDYLGNLSSFDAAFLLDRDDGTRAAIGVDTPYFDYTKREQPKPTKLWRYLEVAERSGAFGPRAIEAVNGSELLELWLDHLVLLSMLQHPSGTWTWGRFVVVHPAGNVDYADACARYQDLLVDDSTFASVTVEELLDSGALPARAAAALRERYVVG